MQGSVIGLASALESVFYAATAPPRVPSSLSCGDRCVPAEIGTINTQVGDPISHRGDVMVRTPVAMKYPCNRCIAAGTRRETSTRGS